MTTASNNKTSYLISSQVPQFVKDDHETFVAFLEEYYKFLAQDGEVEYVTKNFTNYMDIDIIKEHIGSVHALDESEGYHAFLQKMYDNFIRLIPNKVLADKALILKHAKDFYRARGSEKSVRFLLRILLNKELADDFGFYYPKRDVLRASDGKWFIEKSVRIGEIQVDNVANNIAYSNFAAKTIRGLTSNASATVETIDVYYNNGILVTELKLSNSVRNFVDGESVYCFYTEEGQTRYMSATLFSGVVTSVSLIEGGSGYTEGTYVPIEGGGGTGAQVVISSTTKGALTGVAIAYGGAGFRKGDTVLITGGGGSGASVNVATVNTSGSIHPNSYNIIATAISVEANTPLNNTVYSNLKSTTINSWIANGVSAWQFSNCGPITQSFVVTPGTNYAVNPTLSVQGNTVIKSLGILGRMEIIDGGLNYQVGDKLEFFSKPGSFGSGASANVISVAANGKIQQVRFEALTGEIPGGAGYDPFLPPTVNVASATGNGANIVVTALIGYGDSIIGAASTIGKILSLSLVSGGTGYSTPPTINLANMSVGSGATATATVATGAVTYPGRYLNDDGHLSSYNFLQDRDYYQNYSYVIRVDAALSDYKRALLDLTHPAGMRLFGQYLITSNSVSVVVNNDVTTVNTNLYLSTYKIHTSDALKTGVYNVTTKGASYAPTVLYGTYVIKANVSGTYDTKNSQITVNAAAHAYAAGDNVYLQFANAAANITNGLYTISSANVNYFTVDVKNGNTTFIVLAPNTSNLRASSGSGNSNNYITLSQWAGNSNVKISIGDSVNVGGNLVSVVFASPTSNTLVVFPGVRGNIVSNTVFVSTAPYNAYGNVTVFATEINIFVSSQLNPYDNIYFRFLTSDTTLANDRYTLISANSTVLKVKNRDSVNTSSLTGNANVHLKTVTVTSNNHQFSNGQTIFLAFNTGDTGNATNGLYTVTNATDNTFSVTTMNSVTSSGTASIKTSNVIVNVASHGFRTNDSVYMWATSGDTANLANGYRSVIVLDNDRLAITTSNIASVNGSITVYRNFMNVTVNRVGHGLSVGSNSYFMLETGDTANIANGIYRVNSVANTNTYNILHDAITISSNLANIVGSNTGTVYISAVV